MTDFLDTPDGRPVVRWTNADTREWLTRYPLPTDFQWPDRDGRVRLVLPIYRLKGGYGKWLQEAPAFPGLFEQAHAILYRAPANQVLTPEWLAAELQAERALNTKTLFP